MNEFKKYRRIQIAELRPVTNEEAMLRYLPANVSISPEEKENGHPYIGDMIARNLNNHNEQWLITEKHFKDNFEKINNNDNNNQENKMKFKIGDPVLLRGIISEMRYDEYYVYFDGSTSGTYMNKQEIEAGVPYSSDIPLPGQKVWGRDDDNEEWMNGIYIYYNDKQDTNCPHVVFCYDDFDVYRQITTENPYPENTDELHEAIEHIEKELEEIKKRLK